MILEDIILFNSTTYLASEIEASSLNPYEQVLCKNHLRPQAVDC